ncbi:MAG: transporter substrate-binding domain-containing protein [Alphaproteobacteria bacterium]|nr:transporter substrate-binding domain-containing protein [Alphaproteobacteria bacterium]
MKNLLLTILIAALAAFGVIKITGNTSVGSTSAARQPAYERVTSSKILRCAYAAYDPFIIIGADKKISGIFFDTLEEAAKRLGLKVEWAEEVGYGNINSGFMTGRYDAFCAGLWPAGSRAANTIFSRAVVWDPVSVYVRGNDARFDGRMNALNDPTYKIAVIEGDATISMANAFFPKAGRAAITQNQTIGEEILQVTTGKADALFQDYITADKFLQNTPGSLKDLSPGKPPLVYALTVGFNQNETALKGMVDVVLDDMDRDGTIGHIVKQHMGEKANLLFYRENQFKPY